MNTAAITPGLARRDFLKALGAMGLPAAFFLPRQTRPPMTEQTVYLGTYTDGPSEGIYSFRFDLGTGALTQGRLAAPSENPSFLALHPARRSLYAVNEVTSYQGEPGGAVSAYAIDEEARTLTLLNRQPTHGGAPCHLSVDRTGRWVLVANYLGGNLAVFPIADDGRLGPASDVVQHEGHGPDAGRQEAPHAHSIILDEANRFAFAADLGIDRVMIYRLDAEAGRLLPNAVPWATVKAGAGPRHFTFHPSGRYAYVINELDATLTAFAYNAEQGSLETLQTVSTLPGDFQGDSFCADIHLTPDGRFLYGSNRGHDSLAIFAVDPATGRLSAVGHESTGGHWPRNFAVDPSGTFLLAANQRSNTIVPFRIDQQTGTLTPTGHVTETPAPVCLKFA